ncbi:MAG: FG-GAP-like repeat-containing protein [Bacteroidota bacterium]|nr:FG-GAP-like repeat-containing protein [Bacteroidota bacterium]
MKKPLLLSFLLCFLFGLMHSQTTLQQTRHYTWPVKTTNSYDSVLCGLEGIRAVAVGDLNGDGKSEIVATNYVNLGHVHVFSPAGKDTFELVWSSPTVEANGGNSSPRNVLIGDLDNDSRNEIIFESTGNGVYIYEWDGNPGYNFGTKPSQLIQPTNCVGFPVIPGASTSYAEKMTLSDVDNDGKQELVFAYRAVTAAEQKYMIIKANEGWDTNEPGFSSFDLLYLGVRTDLGKWGLNGGSAFGMMPANLDGTGFKEVVIQAYSNNNITILRNDGGVWKLADTTNNKQNLRTSSDGVSYFGGVVTDIDKDGRDEVYLPASIYAKPDTPSVVRAVYYNAPSTPNEIDSAKNTFMIHFHPLIGATSIWGHGFGDIDGNGKPNLYFSTSKLGAAIVTAEFQGGDKTIPANWTTSILWKGDTTYHSLTLRDSLGKIDTVGYENEFLFPSKIFAQKTDFDKNGLEDIITGHQPWYYGSGTTDSVLIKKSTWNVGTSTFDTTSFKVRNTKRLGFVVLEKSTATGVESRNLTFITPEDYKLEQNYPNPFNPTTTINFVLPLNKNINGKIYDMLGKEVRTLINNEDYAKGEHSIVWNGKDNSGKSVATGAYIFRLTAGNIEKTIKMMMVK